MTSCAVDGQDLPPGMYLLTVGSSVTPEEATREIFPYSASVVLIGKQYSESGRSVTYTYLLDYVDG